MRISRRRLIQAGAFAGLERTQWLFREMFAEGQQQIGGLIPGRFIHTGHLSAQQIVAKDFRTAANVGEVGGPAGIRFTASEIAGYSSGTTKTFYLSSADGLAYFAGGAGIFSSTGLRLNGSIISIYDTGDDLQGNIGGSAGMGLELQGNTDKDITIYASGTGTVKISGGSGGVVINEAGANEDFRIEGDNEANLVYIDASADKVGFGTATPAERVHIVDGNLKLTGAGATVKAAGYEIADGNAGADAVFTAGSGETVTVEGGIITSVV